MGRSVDRIRAIRLTVGAGVALGLIAAFCAPSASAAQLLVKFRPGVAEQGAAAALDRGGAREVGAVGRVGVEVVAVGAGDRAASLETLRRDPRVLFAEPDAVAQPQETIPDDPYFPRGSFAIQSGAWGWYLTHTTLAWDVTDGDPGVRIAILDTGLKPQALDFQGQLVEGHNVLDGGADTSSMAGNHGTYVAGAAGLAIDNGSGNAGYCPGCKIMPVQVGTDSGATYADMASGIVWAADHGARVINLSWAAATPSATLAEAVAYARSKGAVVFAAAGNSNCDCPTYPAATPGVLGVAGVSSSGAKASDSNFGKWVALAAPEGNMTAWPSVNGSPGYAPVGGTSLAAPAAAGIAGLLLSAAPGASGAQIEQALRASAAPVSFALGGGRVDAMGALEALGLSDPQVPGPPVNGLAPRVLLATNGSQNTVPLEGSPQVGQTLVRGQGSWTGSSPLALTGVKWYRCSLAGGACAQVGTSWKYTVQAADDEHRLKLSITFGNAVGSTTVSTPPTAPVGSAPPPPLPPANEVPPTIAGTAEAGQAQVASTGSWSGSPTSFAYQWSRCDGAGADCASLAGATGSTYAASSSDVGSTLRVTVTASNQGGSSAATSAPTATVRAAPPPPPATQTLTFSESLTAKVASRSFGVNVGAGPTSARLSFSKCPSLSLALSSAGGSAVGATSGASVLTLEGTLPAGAYTYVVSGSSRCAFTLTVTAVKP